MCNDEEMDSLSLKDEASDDSLEISTNKSAQVNQCVYGFVLYILCNCEYM